MQFLKLKRYGNGVLQGIPNIPNSKTFTASTGAVVMAPVDFSDASNGRGYVIQIHNVGAGTLLFRAGDTPTFADENSDDVNSKAPI
ncbi:MAG: hypothetical protein ACRC1W_11380, partial [Shewanella sp.]